MLKRSFFLQNDKSVVLFCTLNFVWAPDLRDIGNWYGHFLLYNDMLFSAPNSSEAIIAGG